jgi:membrane-associated phospholipid phosphatase
MEGTTLFDSEPGSLPAHLARRSRSRRPLVSGAAVATAGYVVMTILLVGLGLLLTQMLLDGAVGRWDRTLDRWFFGQRTPTFDALTVWGSMLGDTLTVIGIAAVAVLILSIGRHWAQIAFLVGALVIEVTTFVTTTFIIDRERPAVPHLDPGLPTSSFPSGHVAAAIVLYVGLALITMSLVRNTIVRSLAWILAVGLPIAVALSRLYRGMHHPTDEIASMIGAAGCLAFALLATRTGVAVAESNHEAEEAEAATDRAGAPVAVPADALDVRGAR